MKTRLTLLSFFGFLSVGLTMAADTLTLDKTIPMPKVEGRIDHLAADVAGQRLFVAALGNNTVEVLDLKTGKTIQSLPGFAEPQGIAYVPEFNRVFIANGADGTCRILDAQTLKTITSVDCGDDADNVRYDEKAKRIYVSCGGGNIDLVRQVDADHYTAAKTIPTAAGARTSLLIPELKTLCLAVPHRGSQSAEIRVFKTQ
jgi:DNA-binding beta-propeller fold protein YncE